MGAGKGGKGIKPPVGPGNCVPPALYFPLESATMKLQKKPNGGEKREKRGKGSTACKILVILGDISGAHRPSDIVYSRAGQRAPCAPAVGGGLCRCRGGASPVLLAGDAGGHHAGYHPGPARPAHYHVHRHPHCRLDGRRRHPHHGLLWAANHLSPVLFDNGPAAVLPGLPGPWQQLVHHWHCWGGPLWHWPGNRNPRAHYGGGDCLRGLFRR